MWHHPLSLLRLRNQSIKSLYPYNRKSPNSTAICKVLADQLILRLPAQDSSALDDQRIPSLPAQEPSALDDQRIPSLPSQKSNSLDDPLGAFTTLSLGSASELEPASSFHTSSSNLSSTDSSTNFDNESTGPDSSSSDDGDVNEVVHLIEYHLLSIFSVDLDLAARLIPKIHAQLNGDNKLSSVPSVVAHHQKNLNYVNNGRSSGEQRTYGQSSTATTNKQVPQKHGRDCADPDEQGDGDNCKRHRGGSDEDNADTPKGNTDGDSSETPGADPGGSSSNDSTPNSPDDGSSKSPDDPNGDPGDDPNSAGSSESLPNFACHFYKLDFVKYGPWTDKKYEKCPTSRITDLRRIK